MKRIPLLAACGILVLSAPSASGGDTEPNGLRMFAAVFSVRGSVAGYSTGRFGVFIRSNQDTTWRRTSRSDVYLFGLGYFASGSGSRYYLAAGNGVQRSVDGGENWKVLTDWRLMESLSVLPDPVDSAVVYTATPWGVYRTSDDGVSWTLLQNGFRRWYVQSLAMDPRDARVLYAAAEDDLYRTTNSGEDWTPLGTGLSHVHSVLVPPTDPLRLIAGAEEWGIRVSSDRGRTWREGKGTTGVPIYALAATPDGGALYAAGWESGILRSTDGGDSWSRMEGALTGMTILSLAVNPEDRRHIAAGADGGGVYESFDAGRTWSRAGLMGAKVTAIQFYP